MTSIRQRILEAIQARLQDIMPGNDYNTDAGLRVHLGPVQVTEDDQFPLIAYAAGEEGVGPTTEYNLNNIRLPISVQALFLVVDPMQPLAALEPILTDLKRAVFRQADRTLGGVIVDLEYGGAATLDREEGGRHAGVRVQAVAVYRERYGAPEQS